MKQNPNQLSQLNLAVHQDYVFFSAILFVSFHLIFTGIRCVRSMLYLESWLFKIVDKGRASAPGAACFDNASY